MGAMVATVGKHDANVVPSVITMLESLVHRGADRHEIFTPTGVVSTKSFDELTKKTHVSSRVSIGLNISEARGHDCEPNKVMNNYWAIFEGQVFPPNQARPFGHSAIRHMRSSHEAAKWVLMNFDGCYSFAVASDREILVGRDPLGLMPLYYGENEELCAIATERKALWRIGIVSVKPFPPGNLARMNHLGFVIKPVSTIKQPHQRKMTMQEAASRLQTLLEESTRDRVLDVEKVGVAFSGGLDSGVIARIAQKSGVSVNLITVGLEGQSELTHAQEAAKELGLPITIRIFKLSDVGEVLSKVLWLVEEPDTMKVGVAIPFFWTAQMASKLGCHVLLAGQGADELFGGYRRYLTLYSKFSDEKVAEALYNDTIMSYATNYQRDEPVCAYHKVNLRLPFVDTKVIRFALGLPIDLKIDTECDSLRKRVLRQVARNLSIPTLIADKPKKAIQFAAGVDRALRELAKEKGLSPREHVEELFGTIYPNLRVRQGENSSLLQFKIS